MKRKKYIRLPLLASIFFALMACTIFIGGPVYPDIPIPISTEAVGDFYLALEQAATVGADSGQVVFNITESQLTSYLAFKLQQQPEPFLTKPQVFLRDGQIQIFGTAEQGYFQATASMILAVGVDEEGQLTIKLTSADFGPLPAPEKLISVITAFIDEAFTGSLGPIATGIRIYDVDIDNGFMIIHGQIK